MQCNINTSNGTPCKRSVVSGCTLAISPTHVVYCCTQHYAMYLLDVPVGSNPVPHWTSTPTVQGYPITINNNVQEDTMNTTTITAESHKSKEFPFYCGKCDKADLPAYHNRESLAACQRVVVVTKKIALNPVMCGNCRKNGVANPYHDTVAEVKACYASK
jgi:hypothetical protein